MLRIFFTEAELTAFLYRYKIVSLTTGSVFNGGTTVIY